MHDNHQVQLEILRILLFNPESKFGQLNKLNLTSDLLAYHVNQLISQRLITKAEKGYKLTDKGKEYANRLDTESAFAKVERQPKIGVLCHILKGKDYTSEMVVQTRLKEPFYGYKGGITGKIKYGETIFQAAKREILEETGLQGELVHHGFAHYINYKDDELVEDKFLAIMSCFNSKGSLLTKGEGFQNEWMSLSEYKTLDKIYDGELDIIQICIDGSTTYIEKVFQVNEF